MILAESRRRFGIYENSHFEFVVDDDSIRLLVPKDLRDAFGMDDDKALEVVKLILESRRREIEKEMYS